jgi:hypothetical protein
MENPLYKEKVGILSRLIKESSLTLEEALLLLKEEDLEEEKEEAVAESPIKHIPGWHNSYITPNQLIGRLPIIYTSGTAGTGSGSCTTVSNTNLGGYTTTTFLTVDLNN